MRLTILAMILATSAAHADGLNTGLDDPEVIRPAQTWTGPYVGLSYARTKDTAEKVECFKLGAPKACDDPIFVKFPDFKEVRRTTVETTESAAGVLVGYRFDAGRIVPGVELGIYDGDAVPGVTLGLDLGRGLPYAIYSADGPALGVDLRLGDRLTAGVRAGDGSAALTVGWGW